MVETSATIRLKAVDTNLVSTVSNVSTSITNAQIAATALNLAFKGLEKVSSSNAAQLAIGAKNADLIATGMNKAAIASGKFAGVIGSLGGSVFLFQQLAIAADGLGKAGEKVARIPQALAAMQASGVSTQIFQDFANIGEAAKGSDVAIDSLVTNAIARLGEFEAAATRAGTILRSSLRFDESGNALRANEEERLQNALNIQTLVNNELKNAVFSADALAGQYEVLSSGFTNAAESQKVLVSGSKLIGIAEAGGVAADAGQTLQLLTKTLNAYELGADQAASTSAKLNAIVENGLTTIQQLSLGFGATAKQAKQANIDLNDLGAAVSVLTSQGVSTPEALTGIARVSANIIDKTPEAEKALQKLQLNGERIRFDKAEIQAKGFTQALIDLNEAAGGSPATLAQIFPEDVAFRTVNALLAERGKRLTGVRDSIASTDSQSLDEVFDIATSDRTKRFERLANRLQESIIKVGLELAPTLEPGIKVLEDIANGFEKLPEPVKKLIGQFIALQIRTKAYGGAASVLVKTLASLAANYLLVKTISLALTGQLGKEIKTIRDLIVQRKGLGAATLQLFGINQKWRLGEEQLSKTLTKQNKLQQAIALGRKKAADTAKTAATTVVAATSGVSKDTVKEEVQKQKQRATEIAKNAVARGKEIGNAVIRKTKEQINKATDALEVEPFFQSQTKPTTTSPSPVGDFYGFSPLPATAKSQTPTKPITSRDEPFSFVEYPQTSRPKVSPRETSTLDVFVDSDREVAENLAQQVKLEKELEQAQSKRFKAQNKVQALQRKADTTAIQLTEAKSKAIATYNDVNATAEVKKKALIEVQKKENKLSQLNEKLTWAEIEATTANTNTLVAENRVKAASVKTENARIAAQKKYKPLAIAITDAEKASAITTSLSQKATIAKYQAEQLILAQGAKSVAATKALNKAKALGINASRAAAIATAKENRVKEIQTALTNKQQLAERGLYETKIFGQKVLLAETGLIGKLNKVLTTNISLIGLKTVAEKALAKSILFTKNILDVRNLQLLKENFALTTKNIKSFATSGLKLLSGGATKAGSALSGILAPLGALGPLLGVVAFGAIALRSELFGLGAEGRKLAKEYQKLVREQEQLANSLGRTAGVARATRFLDRGDLEGTSKELEKLRDRGLITVKQFDDLITKFPELGEQTTKAQVKQLRQLKKEQQQITVELEKNALETVGEASKQSIVEVGRATVNFTRDTIDATVEAIPQKLKTATTKAVDTTKNAVGAVVDTAKQTVDAIPQGVKETTKDVVEAQVITLTAIPKEVGKAVTQFDKLEASAKKGADRIKDIKQEVNDLARDTQKIESGVFDTILSIPGKVGGGLLSGFDWLINTGAATLANIVLPEQLLGRESLSTQSVAQAREYDSLIKPLSTLSNLQERISTRTKASTSAIAEFKKELALTSEVAEKVAKGFSLTEADLKLEEAEFKRIEKQNNKQIADAETTIKNAEEALKKAKSEEAERLLQSQINQAEIAKENLEAQNEELRELRSQAKKYLTEELPAIRTALQERSDPKLALANARESFENVFIDDEKKILKPLEKLRDEAFKLASTIQESLSLGILDQPGLAGESVAAEELRKIRDEEIEFMEDGELKRGYRLTLADRKALSENIAALENTDLQRQEKKRQLEIQRIKQLGQQKLATEAEVNLKIAQLQQESITNAIAQKEREISEFQELGIRTIDLEIDLEKLRLQQRSAELNAQTTALEQKLADLELRASKAQSIASRQIFGSKEVVTGLQQEKQLNEQLITNYNQQAQSFNNIVGLQKQISTNTVFNAEQQLKSAQVQSRTLAKNIPLQQQQLKLEAQITKEQNKQRLLQAQQQSFQAQIQLTRLKEQKALAERNGADEKTLEKLEIQLENQQLQVEQADSAIRQAQFQSDLSEQAIARQQEQLNLSQKEQIIADQIGLSTAERAKREAEINRTFTNRQGAIAFQLQTLQLEKQTLTEKATAKTQELNLASQLTSNEVKKRNLALNIANIKLQSLTKQLKLEAEILAYNQQQEQIQLRRDKSINQAALQQNIADIFTAQAQVDKLKASGASAKEIQAAEAGLEAQFAQRQSLLFKSDELRQREVLLDKQQEQARESFERRSDLQVDQAQIDALQYLPAKQRERIAKQIYSDIVQGEDIRIPNLGRTIQDVGKVEIEVPELTVPELKFPDIEDIKQDFKAIVAEFKVSNEGTQDNSGKRITIQTLNMEAPINITISGEDSDEIAEKVESRVFSGLAEAIEDIDLD